jgi:hypothetical protein
MLRRTLVAYTEARLKLDNQESYSVKKRFLILLLLAAATLGGACTQSEANDSESNLTKSGASTGSATAEKSPERATQHVTVKVQATTSVMLPGQKVLLAVKITGTTNKGVEWSLKEGEAAGSISLSPDYRDSTQGGPLWVYIASNTPGMYHAIATANADPQHPVTIALVVQPLVSGCTTSSDQIGVWQNITPRQVDLTRGDFFGMQAMVVDPVNPSTIYAGRAMDGIYKSEDCGANWKKISIRRNSHAMASGRSWTMVIDPSDPQTIYTNQGYGAGGVFKTTNGGLDWDQILTPDITAILPHGGFVGVISMDPNDPRHLLVGWHTECPPPRTKACFGETMDGGNTWVLRDGNPSWAGGEGTQVEFLDSQSWIFTSQSNGLWISRDKGLSWRQVVGVAIAHGRGQLYRAVDGSFYLGTANGIMHSIDGSSWVKLPGSQNLIMGVIGDGKTLYFSKAFPYNVPGADPYLPYYSSPERGPYRCTLMKSPIMRNGGAELHLDSIRHILYSTNLDAGLWRLVTR